MEINPEDGTPADEEEDDGIQPPSKGPPVSDSTGSPTVRISENTESNPSTSNPATTTSTRSILRGTPPAEMTRRTTTEAADYQTNYDPSKKMILDKQRKLLIYLGEDGQNKEFHVEDFVGCLSSASQHYLERYSTSMTQPVLLHWISPTITTKITSLTSQSYLQASRN